MQNSSMVAEQRPDHRHSQRDGTYHNPQTSELEEARRGHEKGGLGGGVVNTLTIFSEPF